MVLLVFPLAWVFHYLSLLIPIVLTLLDGSTSFPTGMGFPLYLWLSIPIVLTLLDGSTSFPSGMDFRVSLAINTHWTYFTGWFN